MNRNDLATELRVWPWDVDNWLLWGCPGKKFGRVWEFDIDKVKKWLRTDKIKIKGIKSGHLSERGSFGDRWLGNRCPECIEKGFAEEEAGRLYTIPGIVGGECYLRRSGFPCGHLSGLYETRDIFRSE